MAPLSGQDEALIEYLLQDGFSVPFIVDALSPHGSRTAVYRRYKRFKEYGSIFLGKGVGGAQRLIQPHMRDYLVDVLAKKGDYWLDELQYMLLAEFGQFVSLCTIGRCLRDSDFTYKIAAHQASQRDAVVRVAFLENFANFTAKQLVYVDETYASDKVALRKFGWSPKGLPCRVEEHLYYSDRYSILPAYTVDGYLPNALIKQGSVTAHDFLLWLQSSVLPHCKRFPGRRSVLVVDNCATHNREDVRALCRPLTVLVCFLPPYSPDLNPIEPSFRLLKQWIRRHWQQMPMYGADNWRAEFETFLQMAVDHWGDGVEHKKLFQRCGVVLDEEVGVR